MDGDSVFVGVLIGCIIGLILFGLIGYFSIEAPLRNDIEELGGSICLEEHQADFKSYRDGVLTCKDSMDSYDGIFVEVV